MKKLALIAIALITIQAVAQERKERPNNQNRSERFNDFSAEEMATLQTKKMTLHLDLTESQQREIQKLNLENATNKKAIMEARKAKKESGSIKKPSKEDRLKMMNTRLDHQIAMKAKMKQILNAEQFEKWEKEQASRSGKFKDSKKNKGMHKGEGMKK